MFAKKVVLLIALTSIALMAILGGSKPRQVSAELVEDWTYPKLFKDSQIVVICKPTKSVPTNERWNLLKQHGIDVDLGGVETTFSVKSVLKGAMGKEISIFHYQMIASREVAIVNPPQLIRFRASSIKVKIDGNLQFMPLPDYLLFLSANKDGRIEPASGQFNASESVFEISKPWSSEYEPITK